MWPWTQSELASDRNLQQNKLTPLLTRWWDVNSTQHFQSKCWNLQKSIKGSTKFFTSEFMFPKKTLKFSQGDSAKGSKWVGKQENAACFFFYNNNTYFGLGFCTSSRCSGMHNGSAGIKFDPGGWWGFSIQGHFKIDGLSHFFFVFFSSPGQSLKVHNGLSLGVFFLSLFVLTGLPGEAVLKT